jgi:predicted CXXCH cytochrome family protein
LVGESGGWYRFLISSNHPDPATGVKGIEDIDWELTVSSADHNEYYGSSKPDGTTDNSISHFCAGCHGYFHGIIQSDNNNGASPWLRHPTNVAIPNSGEYKLYNTSDGTSIGQFSTLAPVARAPGVISGLTSASSTVTPGSDQVMCLSCHRAHGSPYADMMRWDYLNNCSAGTTNNQCGCFVCHTAKDD